MFGLLEREGLGRFYSLARDARLAPVGSRDGDRSLAWLEPLLEAANGRLELDVQGLQCAACVWLIDSLFQRAPGATRLIVNSALGRASLVFDPKVFDAAAFVRHVETFGYRFGPALKSQPVDALTWRLGVCAAITLNVMLFSLSFYFGLAPNEPDLFRLFTALSFALSTLGVLVGGWPFLQAAVRGLKAGVLHLDLPIALGIALVYATSLVQAQQGRGDLAYLDTLNTFITLMLVGRWLQRRLIEKNRAWLLEDAGLDGLVCRRIEASGPRVVSAAALREGDALLLAPHELLPVDARLDDARAEVSLDWISGEATPAPIERGARVRAGSFNAQATPMHLTALASLEASALPDLLRRRARDDAQPDAFWNRLARNWATRVLLISSGAFVLWLPHGFTRALDVAIALLVITCPCAIGLSIPLAYELVHARLRRAGFYARRDDLLDNLRHVKKVLFDKTGTLTSSRLALTRLPELTESQQNLAYNLAARSAHPASAAIARALELRGASYDPALVTTELPGIGIACEQAGHVFRLGRSARGTALSSDGQVLALFELDEVLRPGAEEQVHALAAEGLETWLISGDAPSRVHALARRLGFDPRRVLSGQTPAEKAAEVARLDARDTLYLGDGVNDAPAFAAAFIAGTPAVERPVMPSRSAFFFVGDGLGSLTLALALSKRLHQVVRQLLALSLSYNVLAVAAGLLGFITPLRAAVFMPLSSLSLLLFTVYALREPAPRKATASTVLA